MPESPDKPRIAQVEHFLQADFEPVLQGDKASVQNQKSYGDNRENAMQNMRVEEKNPLQEIQRDLFAANAEDGNNNNNLETKANAHPPINWAQESQTQQPKALSRITSTIDESSKNGSPPGMSNNHSFGSNNFSTIPQMENHSTIDSNVTNSLFADKRKEGVPQLERSETNGTGANTSSDGTNRKNVATPATNKSDRSGAGVNLDNNSESITASGLKGLNWPNRPVSDNTQPPPSPKKRRDSRDSTVIKDNSTTKNSTGKKNKNPTDFNRPFHKTFKNSAEKVKRSNQFMEQDVK